MRYLLMITIFLAGCASSTPSPTPVTSTPSAVEPESNTSGPAPGNATLTVTQEQWIEGMKGALPVALCKKEGYFRQCFDISADVCIDRVNLALLTCLEQVAQQLPAVLKQPEDGRQWGSVVGSCVGQAFETSLYAENLARTDNPKCASTDAWL